MTRDVMMERSRVIEKELVARIFFDTKYVVRASTIVSFEDFLYYGEYYKVILQSHVGNKNVNTELAQAKLMMGDFLENSFRPIEHICKDLKDVSNALRVQHTLLSAADNISYHEVDTVVSDIQREIMKSVKSSERENTSMSVIANDWIKLRDSYIEKIRSGNALIGLSCGYSKLDAIIDGLRPGHLWIMGGYTSRGKTFASLNIAANLIKQGKRVVYYSLEMNSADIVSRLIGILTNQNGKSLIKGYGNQSKAEEAMKELVKSNLSIHTTKTSLSQIHYSMYEENITLPVDLFIVDYLQLVTVKGVSEYTATTMVAQESQQLAQSLGVPIMLLSQISNDGAKTGGKELMSTFKGSGAIAAASDLAIEIIIGEEDDDTWKAKQQAGEKVKMIWNIKKNRHGVVGSIDMYFKGDTGIFEQNTSFDDF